MIGGNAVAAGRVLLVEGRDEMHVVDHLRRSCSQMPDFDIIDKQGVSNLLSSIRGEILVEDRTTVGIVVDANDDLKGRWQAVSDRLRAAQIPPPETPAPDGAIIDGRPRVGVWLMPDNRSCGELEDFISGMISSDDPVWPLSQAYIDSIPVGDRKFAENKILRAKVHAWLAGERDSPADGFGNNRTRPGR